MNNLPVNEGSTDRTIRAILGGAALTAALTGKGAGRLLALGLGAMLLATATTGHCPAYTVAGVDTREK
ncbi:YgaP family membrane protein [Deinococcus wulumuqiensis]|nr:DUF2892 domain-containing protein [Deinococcus wulumuqiensis]AXG98269.1 DUF2892 domain-containing protein [Deinococcus wulumuqiensis]QII19792.1 DUF2892 domain-containing protein [Deinococcus wulumuqiensis R12]